MYTHILNWIYLCMWVVCEEKFKLIFNGRTLIPICVFEILFFCLFPSSELVKDMHIGYVQILFGSRKSVHYLSLFSKTFVPFFFLFHVNVSFFKRKNYAIRHTIDDYRTKVKPILKSNERPTTNETERLVSL